MAKIRIVFNGLYYEYDDKELSPEIYYDLEDNDFIQLFEKRREIIKSLDVHVSMLNKKLSNEDKVVFLKPIIEKELEKLYSIEESIDNLQKQKNINYEWYHKTNPKNEDEVIIPKNEIKYFCGSCGKEFDDSEILDINHRKIEDIENHVCPSCGKNESVCLENTHLFKAKIIQKKIDEADDNNKRIILLNQMIEEFGLVNDYDEDDSKEAIIELSMAHQRKARLLLSMNDILTAYEEIDIALSGWEYALDIGALYTCDFNVLAMGYIVRETCCLELKKDGMLSLVISDGELVEKRLDQYYSSNKELCVQENRMDYLENVTEEFQFVSMMNYINVKKAMCFLNKPQEQIDGYIQKAKRFLNSCDKLNQQEKEEFYEELNSIVRINKVNKQKEGCYIATAVYGDYEAPSVIILRRYRDDYLQKSFLGRTLVKVYYKVSPPIANRLKTTRSINGFVKKILDLFVNHLKKNIE